MRKNNDKSNISHIGSHFLVIKYSTIAYPQKYATASMSRSAHFLQVSMHLLEDNAPLGQPNWL